MGYPYRASLSALYDFAGKAGVVEIGAGKGIWAEKLRLMGVNVSAYDIFAEATDQNIYHIGEHRQGVQVGGVSKAGAHPEQTLFLSYPAPGESMGADALKAYTAAGGTKLAFIGDRPSPGSNDFNTGDQEFHQMLDNDWVLKEVVEMPHLPDGYTISAAKMYLYERRGAASQTSDANVDTNTAAAVHLKESKLSDRTSRPDGSNYINGVESPIIQELKKNYKPVQFVAADGTIHTGSSLYKPVGEVEKGSFESGLFVEIEGETLTAPASKPPLDSLTAIPDTRIPLYRDHDGYVWLVGNDGSREFQPDLAIITESNIHNPLADSVSANAAKMKALNNSELPPAQFREQLMSVIGNSPQLEYSTDAITELNRRQHQYLNAINSGLDPKTISSNCKDCVAALYRTIQDGRIVTAYDVTQTLGPNRKPIGHLGPMEIEDHSDSALSAAKTAQMEWLAKAAGTETLRPVSVDQLAATAKETGASEFVVVVKINSEVDHVILGSKKPDGSMTYYDPQSGVRWSPESIESANPTYYPMVARAQTESINPEGASRPAARPNLLKESRSRRNPNSNGDSEGGADVTAEEFTSRIDQAAPELQRSLKLLARVAGRNANNRAVIDRILNMDPENLPVGLKEIIDPEIIKVMKADIFDSIREHLNLKNDTPERRRSQNNDEQTTHIEPPDDVPTFETAPEIDYAASKRKMSESGSDSETVDMISVLTEHKYQKSGRRGAEYAEALKQTEFFRQFKDSISDAQVVGEGNESVVMKVKGPFVLGEGNAQMTVDEMVVKLTKPLRGEWHEDWGNWDERPWDALTISHEEVGGIDVYVQEAAHAEIAPEHEELFRKALEAYNKAHTAYGDDRYVLWDGDERGGAGKQFGYSSLPARPFIDAGSVWIEVNGQPRRVVLLDHWAVKRYGEDGQAEFE